MTQELKVNATIDMTIARAIVLTADEELETRAVVFSGKVINHTDEKLTERDCKRFVRQRLGEGEELVKVTGFNSITLTADIDLATLLNVSSNKSYTDILSFRKGCDITAELNAIAEKQRADIEAHTAETETVTE